VDESAALEEQRLAERDNRIFSERVNDP